MTRDRVVTATQAPIDRHPYLPKLKCKTPRMNAGRFALKALWQIGLLAQPNRQPLQHL